MQSGCGLAASASTFGVLGWPALTAGHDGEEVAVERSTRSIFAMEERRAFIAVYMMSNRKHGTLYIGVTSDLISRVVAHREGDLPGFTRRYGLKRLAWYEPHDNMVVAVQREKSLKKYKRDWKTNLIESDNPHWEDLFHPLWSPNSPS